MANFSLTLPFFTNESLWRRELENLVMRLESEPICLNRREVIQCQGQEESLGSGRSLRED